MWEELEFLWEELEFCFLNCELKVCYSYMLKQPTCNDINLNTLIK